MAFTKAAAQVHLPPPLLPSKRCRAVAMEAININPFLTLSIPPLPRHPKTEISYLKPYFPPHSKSSHASVPLTFLPTNPSTLKTLVLQKIQSLSNGGLNDKKIYGGDLVCNGGIGTMLMSTTAAISKAKVSPFLWTLAGNPTFVSGLVAWVLAQSMKVFLNFFVERRWDLGMLFNSGGMPSSHSALCTALTASVALCHGVGDSLFPVCLGFSLIVMYDAIGVRRHAGMQAEVLNKIVEDLFQGHPISQRKLKELLGHTPSQVIAGALLGILVACVCCQGGVVI